METWITIAGYPDYEVSDAGMVRRKGGFSPEPGYPIRAGYMVINLKRDGKWKTHSVHRLVTDAFLGPCPEGMERNHIDGNRANNRLDNLEFVTPSENILGAVRRGHRGENRWNAVLTDDLVRTIRQMRGEGKTVSAICRELNLNQSAVAHVAAGRSWKHVA